ncbi:MAG: hypothetical protein ACYCVH_02710 [Ignavibacteriaceae bacterium]
MADLTKYDILINDLSSIESRVSILISKFKDTFERNIELENLLAETKRENMLLLQEITKLENEIQSKKENGETNLFNSLTLKERDNLKVKLQNLISKIDYHLSS